MKMKYVIARNHKVDLLTEHVIYLGTYNHVDFKKLGLSFKFPNCRYFYPSGNIDWPEKQSLEISNSKLSESQYQSLINFIEIELKNYKLYLNKFRKNISSADKEDLIEFFDNASKVGSLVMYFTFEQALAKKMNEENIPSEAIKSSKTETTNLAEEISILAKRYKNKINDNENIPEIEKLVSEYGYLGMKYFFGNPWNYNDIFEMVKTNTHKMNIGNEATEKFSSKFLFFTEEILRLRTEHWETMCLAGFLFRKFIIERFPKLKYDKIIFLSIDEIIETLYGSLDYENVVKNRKEFLIDITPEGVKIIFDGIKEDGSIRYSLDIKEIKGTSAYKGIVRGNVRVLLNSKESSKLKKGEILVATMSTPDFLPAMMNAGAFITDIGGITSHAAIVARELKKPCIIGTKIATKVLKDGDLVEVDADKGIVRIIERA